MIRNFVIGTAALAISTAALAAVTFDPATGTGFVGKGDVQLAFGWNNAAAQANVNGVSFSYATETTYDVTCEWDTVAGKSGKVIHHVVAQTKQVNSASDVQSSARKTGQWTGYNLNGFGTTTTSGNIPVLGGPGNHPGEVTMIEDLGTTGGLSVTFNGTTVAL